MCSTLVKIENTCFCCLAEDQSLNNLFKNSPETLLPLAECYAACTGLELNMEGPIWVCSVCEQKLTSFFEFREICRASYKVLTENSASIVVIKREEPPVGGRRLRKSRKKALQAISEPEFAKVPSDVDASDLESDFLCFHCDVYLPNHRTYKQHYEQHRAGNGYKRINRTCEICHVETPTFVSHMLEKHRDYKPFKCKFCTKEYRTSGELRIHLNSHTTIVGVKCLACQEVFNRPNSLRTHILNHDNPKNEYFCPTCGQPFHQFRQLHSHFESNHEKTSSLYPCIRCKKVFMSQKTWADHICLTETIDPSPSDSIECNLCSEPFFTDDDLFSHELICQKSSGLHPCETCGKTFDTKAKMQKHVQIVHLGQIKLICEVCGHGAKTNAAYELHMASHTEESSFKCSRVGCKSAFKHQNLLKNHMRQHDIKDGLLPKKFECHHCKKTFAQFVGIKRHMGTHFETPELRPFKCSMCEKRLQTKNDLDVHLVTHSNVKNFQCSVCPRLFTSQTAANRHYQGCHVNNYFQCAFCDDKQFKTTTMFRAHLFVHRGFSPYNCPACATKYTHMNLFKRHLRNVHKIEYEESVHGYVEQERDYIDRLIRQCKRKDDSCVLMPQPLRKKRKKSESLD